MCNEKWIVKTTCDNLLSGWIEKKLQSTSQTKLAPKKGHGHCLVVCCPSDPYNFLNPSETITSEKYAQQIDEMHWKLQHPQLVLINRTGLILLHDTAQPHATQPMGCEVLLHPPRSPDFLPTNYHIFKHLDNFSQGKCFHNQQEVENAFQEFTESQSMDFHATGINKLISCWQKCVNCNGSYFD